VGNKDVQKALRLNSKVWNGHKITVEKETASEEQRAKLPKNIGTGTC